MPTESMTTRHTRRVTGSLVRSMRRSGSVPSARSSGSLVRAMMRSGSIPTKRTPGSRMDALRARIQARSLKIAAGASGALAVKETAGGYTYPEIPQQVAQGIPDYYRQSRSARGLPELPPEAGQLARKIGRYVADMPNDPDNRGSIEATIAQVLVAAAQAAEQAGDGANAARLAEIAGLWAKRVVAAGGQAPTIDPDKPLSGVHFDYGYFHAPDVPVFSPGLTNHQLASVAAVGAAVMYGRESKSLARGGLYGALAYVLASGALSVFRRQD